MSVVYIDSSVIVALLFEEASARKLRRHLIHTENYSSCLLEAEVYSAAAREDLNFSKVEEMLTKEAIFHYTSGFR